MRVALKGRLEKPCVCRRRDARCDHAKPCTRPATIKQSTETKGSTFTTLGPINLCAKCMLNAMQAAEKREGATS